MSQLGGIVSLFFIAAAFLTSCNPPPQQGYMPMPSLQLQE
jgi:hypothetical protein